MLKQNASNLVTENKWSTYNGHVSKSIESIKTTSMEDVSTGVLEQNKEYLRGKD